MHATYPVIVRHHPGWFGVLVGLILGIALTIGGLLVLDRIDLGATTPSGLSSQTAAEMYRVHQALEYTGDVNAATNEAIRAQFIREHQADMNAALDAEIRAQFIREHQADMALP
jgi:hypothetical protein